MRLSLKTKFTLTTAVLVLGVVALISGLYVAALTRQVIQHADELARFVTLQVFFQAQHALRDAKNQERAPASESPQDLREYVRQSLDEDAALTSLVEAVLGYSPLITKSPWWARRARRSSPVTLRCRAGRRSKPRRWRSLCSSDSSTSFARSTDRPRSMNSPFRSACGSAREEAKIRPCPTAISAWC